MGESGREGPADWSRAWEEQGYLQFPQRRRPLWWRAALTFFLTVNAALQLANNLHDAEPVIITVLAGTALPFWAWLFGYTTWQLITRRPLLRIDQVGIHYGTSNRLRIPWNSVDTISDPIGKWLFAHVNVRPYDEKPRRVPITHVHVGELRPFAIWLRAKLDDQRTTAAR